MLIDRITSGFAKHSSDYQTPTNTRSRATLIGLLLFLNPVVAHIGCTVTIFDVWPREMEVNPARAMNEGLTYIIVNYREQISRFKPWPFSLLCFLPKLDCKAL